MDSVLLNCFPFQIDLDQLFKNLHMEKESKRARKVMDLVDAAHEIGRPKALYRACYLDSKGDNHVVIDGIKFTSRVLRVNLEDTYRVFPYLVTSGTELEEWSESVTDMFDSYCADVIKELAMGCARKKLMAHLDQEYGLKNSASMNPGSLADWPLKEQKNLFALLGDTEKLVGVKLTSSFLMVPIKTVSGIRFPKEGTYENCQLCSREVCPGRKAPYDKNLYDKKYKLT